MRIIGILVAITLLALLAVWWLNFSFGSVSNSMTTVQQADPSTGRVDPGKDPLEYTQEEIDQYEKFLEERSKEVDSVQ